MDSDLQDLLRRARSGDDEAGVRYAFECERVGVTWRSRPVEIFKTCRCRQEDAYQRFEIDSITGYCVARTTNALIGFRRTGRTGYRGGEAYTWSHGLSVIWPPLPTDPERNRMWFHGGLAPGRLDAFARIIDSSGATHVVASDTHTSIRLEWDVDWLGHDCR